MTVHYEADLSGIEGKIRRLNERVDELDSAQRSTTSRLDSLASQQTDLDDRLDATDATIEEGLTGVRRELQQAQAQLTQLTQHLTWLHHHVTSNTSIPVADLEEVDDLASELLARMRAGNATQQRVYQLRAQIAQQQQLVAKHQRLTERYQTHDAAAVSLAKTIEQTRAETPQRAAAIRDYENARKITEAAASELAEIDNDVRAARVAIADVERDEAKREPVVTAGRAATRQLYERLRGRVADAAARYQLFPSWLVTWIGHTPPRGRHDSWVDLATDVVQYRLLHGIVDQDDALGASTPAHGHPHERGPLRRRLADFP